jgi:enoyl-CoA hydratase/carnithine racemase
MQEFTTYIAYDVLEDYGKALIESDKPIMAIVQGKIIGVAFTMLALCDRVFAIDGATFKAPLVKLAQGPEMASAYTFPKTFGKKFADELIVGAREVPARELEKYGFLEVCKDLADAKAQLKQYTDMVDAVDWVSFVEARKLMRCHERDILLKINRLECANLVERWCNPELPALMVQYMLNTKVPAAKL